ncbi:hypothetical protein [Shewanella salipaludis]|uniref:Uncharacterized protein n=1 Tax=Shewanella salipaludis TaxID=2723052 RepID=A0A972FVX8_9GAMM|nr:hypothetical protein [Shewanella salipaludis]NMH66229.1 hypothetical protein [Shewanella salipaludis]
MNKLITAIVICFCMMGCSSLNEVQADAKPASSYVGENVKITTYSGETFEFEVEGATELAVYGEGKSINMADIEKMEVEELSLLKSISLSGGLYMLSAVVIAVAVL